MLKEKKANEMCNFFPNLQLEDTFVCVIQKRKSNIYFRATERKREVNSNVINESTRVVLFLVYKWFSFTLREDH